jgi:serine/threonine-protein kinase
MPAKVTLTVTQGPLRGQEFIFAERTTCIMGRADDCHPRLPNDEDHRTISRHHCLLDINPPDIRIRDFGSRNGTFVNGKKIGQRGKDQTPAQGAAIRFPEHDLEDGDRIELGDTVFQVGIIFPVLCAECWEEIATEQQAECLVAPSYYLCPKHRPGQTRTAGQPGPAPRRPRRCPHCSKDVSAEIGDHRLGEMLCAACRADPQHLMSNLLDQARSGSEELAAIRGYTLEKELGRGGMGVVFLARHEPSGERLALKMMLPGVAVQEQAKERFLREVENTRALTHPHVVQLRQAGCSQGLFFFTLEYCAGGSVDRLVQRRGGKLPLAEAGPILLQALDGLDYAHTAEVPFMTRNDGTVGRGRGLVHRDLSPHNLFLSGSGASQRVKIGDYGLAKAFDFAGLSGYTRTGVSAGKPTFMPRQQVINFKYARPEVDVWALAATFYYLLTGVPPRDFPEGQDCWQVVLQSDAVPLQRRDPSIPPKLAAVIDQALIDKPAIPFPSAAEFKRALEGVL